MTNRRQTLTYMYFALPARLHYRPQSRSGNYIFPDLYLGLEPRINFLQRYILERLSPSGHWDRDQSGVSVYNLFQLRVEVGISLKPFVPTEYSFYVDLLPTYRRATGMGNVHAFGVKVRF